MNNKGMGKHAETSITIICSGGTWTKNLGVPNYIFYFFS